MAAALANEDELLLLLRLRRNMFCVSEGMQMLMKDVADGA